MMAWVVQNAGWLSDVVALAASISLFIPLVGLVGQSRHFRALQDLAKKGTMSSEDLERARQLIIAQRFSDGHVKWLWIAGGCFLLAGTGLVMPFFTSG